MFATGNIKVCRKYTITHFLVFVKKNFLFQAILILYQTNGFMKISLLGFINIEFYFYVMEMIYKHM